MKITRLDKVEKIKANMEGAKDAYKQVPFVPSLRNTNKKAKVFANSPATRS